MNLLPGVKECAEGVVFFVAITAAWAMGIAWVFTLLWAIYNFLVWLGH